MNRVKGKVLWFDAKKGYGFIRNRNIKEDIYVHFSDIEVEGYKELIKDDKVSFFYDEEHQKATKVKIEKRNKNK